MTDAATRGILRLYRLDLIHISDNMKITINGKKTETSARSIQELAEELSLPERGVAIAIAQRMIPRSEWAATTLQENDSIVIIKAACGG